MSGIRPLEREDLPSVVGLFELVMRSDASRPLPQLTGFFERTLLDNPWADPEIPSLVYEGGDGEVLGVVCSNTRRMLFDSAPIRMACSAYLLAHPRARKRAIGALLMKAYLDGPQDLTITDGATEVVRRMWEAMGGKAVHLGCLSYVQVFRPSHLAADHVLHGRVGSWIRPALTAFDRVSARVASATLVPRIPEATAVPLTPSLMIEHLPTVAAPLLLHADYDRPYLDWLLGELDNVSRWGPIHPGLVTRGPLWAELVHVGGRVAGWYVCQLRKGGFCRVLQFAVTPEGAEKVYDLLAYHAWQRGAAGLYGRIEPRIVAPLSHRRCFIRFGDGRLLVHTRDARILGAVLAGDALLTRLDGEWW